MQSIGDIISKIFAVTIIAIVSCLALISFYLARKAYYGHNTYRYDIIVADARRSRYLSLIYKPLVLSRMILITLNVVLLGSYPLLQVFLFLSLQLLFTVYLFSEQPLVNRNKIEMFNELMLLLTASFLFAYTGYVQDAEVQYNFGWALVGVMELTIAVNTFIAVKEQIPTICRVTKKAIHHLKNKCKRTKVYA